MRKYSIRSYQVSDQSYIENICQVTGSEQLRENELMTEALLAVFCRYYIEEEPEHCFVAVNDNNEVIGYILVAHNFQLWNKIFNMKVSKSNNPVTRMMGNATIEKLSVFSDEYPAHLHIDIHPDYQGIGLGKQLMSAAIVQLKNCSVPGLMLNVAKENKGAVQFYKRLGFECLEESAQDLTMGMKL